MGRPIYRLILNRGKRLVHSTIGQIPPFALLDLSLQLSFRSRSRAFILTRPFTADFRISTSPGSAFKISTSPGAKLGGAAFEDLAVFFFTLVGRFVVDELA